MKEDCFFPSGLLMKTRILGLKPFLSLGVLLGEEGLQRQLAQGAPTLVFFNTWMKGMKKIERSAKC